MICIYKCSFVLEIILEILQVLVLWSDVSDHVYILSKLKIFFPPVLFFIRDHIYELQLILHVSFLLLLNQDF
jgi:hypothetical protein